ncbi:uncharacterized protein F5147DRAFT_716359 [Suillus discolor]|uniref:Secreted protein n=1 Tax=Suillus discolor TaxID=1912936 RepID=A0A9P7JPQ5_9AGAM|nr:uncharacterized protein F5147DRAFT_716359 [Suillus discolor]KAG2096512.1 hypothetical protein F5147DRAFT_716359 [Suillus discolor]
MRIHYLSDCWVIWCFCSAARLLNTPMPMHDQRSSSKINLQVKHSPRCHHRKLSLPPPRRPRLLLLIVSTLSRQVQQARSHTPFHCRLVSFDFCRALTR